MAFDKGRVVRDRALPAPLDEFCDALEAEVRAASAGASASAVQLSNGRKLRQLGSAYQYSFTIDANLQMPDGAPVELRLPGGDGMEAQIVSTSGNSIVIGVRVPLGDFVPKALLVSDLTMLLKRLADRIDERADRPNASGERLLGARVISGQPVRLDDQDAYLNVELWKAVETALGLDTTYLWGPPGTGKTRVIGELARRLVEGGSSVLVVSHTNKAVDEALISINERLRPDRDDGSVLRVGQPSTDRVGRHLLLETHVQRRQADLASQLAAALERAEVQSVEVTMLGRRLDLAEWVAVASEDLPAMRRESEAVDGLAVEVDRLAGEEELLAAQAEDWDHQEQLAPVAIKLLAELDALERAVAAELSQLKRAETEHQTATADLSQKTELLEHSLASNGLTRRWKRLPDPVAQRAIVGQAERQARLRAESVHGHRLALAELEATARSRSTQLQETRSMLRLPEGDTVEAATAFRSELKIAQESSKDASAAHRARSYALLSDVAEKVTAVHDWGLMPGPPADTTEGRFDYLQTALNAAKAATGGQKAESIAAALSLANDRLRATEAEVAIIERQLQEVEAELIREASLIATTLTRAYLRDPIQKRGFDVVILDEASMAPIPALWLVAGLAERTVVVGDFLQLPPICQSTDAIAQKWLGRDVFALAGFESVDSIKDGGPAHFVALEEQHRMHPTISSLPNTLVYEGHLRDAAGMDKDSVAKDFAGWFQPITEGDHAVTVVNTESLHAWVTSVPRGRGASRLNFLSAVASSRIAQSLLSDARPRWSDGQDPRVIIACPYQPHSLLLTRLLDDQKINGEVTAGTAHQLQGQEAPIVILDLVNDEPHWKVGMFMVQHDEGTMRLLNVAMTRAQRRLIVVGDLQWIRSNTKPHAFMRRFLELAVERGVVVDALELLPDLDLRAAVGIHSAMSGGPAEMPHERTILTQELFFPAMERDLSAALTRIVIYSPFITNDRLARLEVHLRHLVGRGVSVWVVTKALSERSKKQAPVYQQLENALAHWGVRVIHKLHMHEKLVFIDKAIIWTGSLNPLSFSNTQEIMERRANKVVVADFARTIRLDEMLQVYVDGNGTCPVCRGELVPAEGKDEPFYWRCTTDGCYSRSLGQTAPRGGTLQCGTCGGEFSFGAWGDKPAWRCVENSKHRQAVHPSHLRLPKMRALIPKRDLARLEGQFSPKI